MNEHRMRFRLGLFVLCGLLLLAGLITLFGSAPALFRSQRAYVVCFHDAPGVAPGTPVRRSGVRIGEVSDVQLDDRTGQVRVHLLIEKNYTLRRSEQPTLVQGLIGNDATIDLVPYTADGQPPDLTAVPPGAEVAGVRQASVHSVLNRASEVIPSTKDTLADVRQSVQRFEQLAPLMEETLREYRDLAKATREVVPELRRTNEEVRQLAAAAREAVPGLGRTSDEVRDLAHAVRDTVPQLQKTNEQIQVTAAAWGKVGNHADELLVANQERLGQAVDNLNESLTRINAAFSDDNQRNLTAVLKNVKTSSDSLESLTRSTDEMMKEGRQTMRKVGEADQTLTDMQQATRPLADRSATIMKNLDESSEKLNKTLDEARDFLRFVSQGDGTLRRLVTDPTLYNHLDEAACVLVRLLPQVDRILKDLELFADKLARHPEALGLGGVVHPSSGVKR